MMRIGSIRIHTFLVAAGIAAALTLPTNASAQLAKGQKFLGVHLGLSGVGSAAAIGASGEVAYNDRISLGAWLDTWSYGDNYAVLGDAVSWNVRYVALAGTGAYHFPVESNPKLDPFLGLSLGYYVVSSSTSSSIGGSYGGASSRIFLGGFGGIRYHFREKVSAVARAGFGASYFTLGVDFGM